MKIIDYKPIPIYNDVEWNIDSEALHILLLAPTGAGKSVFLHYLASMVLKRGHQLFLIDGKNTTFGAFYESIGVHVATNADEVISLLTTLVENMENDYSTKLKQDDGISVNFSHLNLPAKVIIFDEVLAVLDSVDSKQKKEMVRLLGQISLKGRGAGYSLVLSSQRLLASDMPKGISEQAQTKIILGSNVSEELFHLVTGMYLKDIGTRYRGGVGKGYALTPKTGLCYIETPFLDSKDESDFFKLAKKYKARGDDSDEGS